MHVIEPLQDAPPDPAQPAGPPRPLLASYANYFEVGHNAFEFLIDAGQVEPQSGNVQLMSRVAVSPVHAKLLAQLLARAIAQFEATHHEIPDIGDPEPDLAILPRRNSNGARSMRAASRCSAAVATSPIKTRVEDTTWQRNSIPTAWS
ncbi:DUF3467 domain-containing protein [Burkholderia ambifaria]|uniref:DUF3467 domain-containing protein n=1 Tax=Burkholderia ambifaria TaxID=152480 RepID=UPI001E40F809|nr:DUF3467 domain-containing protein [Burkholderia ambifaria]UEP52485.1 DUF3467 domain-containing protein [Burkholderia ambifaria]